MKSVPGIAYYRDIDNIWASNVDTFQFQFDFEPLHIIYSLSVCTFSFLFSEILQFPWRMEEKKKQWKRAIWVKVEIKLIRENPPPISAELEIVQNICTYNYFSFKGGE